VKVSKHRLLFEPSLGSLELSQGIGIPAGCGGEVFIDALVGFLPPPEVEQGERVMVVNSPDLPRIDPTENIQRLVPLPQPVIANGEGVEWEAFEKKANRQWGPSTPPVRCFVWGDGRGDVVFNSMVWKLAVEGRAVGLRYGDTVKVPKRMTRFVLHNVLAEMPKVDCRAFEWPKGRGLLRLKGKASKEHLLEKLLLARFGAPEEFLAWLKYNSIPCDVTRATDGPSEEELEDWLFPSKALKKSLAPFATKNPMDANERAGLVSEESEKITLTM
jgi:hypothetical protein